MRDKNVRDKGCGDCRSINFAPVDKATIRRENTKTLKIMEATVTRSSVLTHVRRRMDWLGTRSPEERDYDRVSLSEADTALFHSFFDEAAMHAIDLCRNFLSSVSNTDEGLTLDVNLPAGIDVVNFTQTLETLLWTHVLGLWQEIVTPARAAATMAKQSSLSLKFQSLLYHNPAPKREAV